MHIDRIRQQFGIAIGFFEYMRKPLDKKSAIAEVRHRIENRDKSFLGLAGKLIYENPNSPYRKLLEWAGCDYADLESGIRTDSLESTLEKLRAAGVYLTLEEFKSQVPICRKGLTIETSEADFDNPYILGKSIQGSTSGSRSKSTRVLYDWDFLAEEASNEMLLYEAHDLGKVDCAFWLPQLPSISGIHNLLVHLRFRKPPVKWFSHLPGSPRGRTSMEYIRICSRIFGTMVPIPEFTDMDHGEVVARWMEQTRCKKGICMVKTFASSAVRIVQAALEKGIDISGNVIFTGGEPLTERRSRYLQSAGIRAFPRYVATETGLIGAACCNGDAPDSMHIYTDRLALIQCNRTSRIGNQNVNSFLFSTLSCTTGKILFNTELGDFGKMEVKSCDCLFGQIGMNVHVSEVRSFDKLTGEGMTLLGSVLDEVIGSLVEKAGGGPDDYQFWENQDEEGLMKLTIAISPHIPQLDEKRFEEAILEKLRKGNQGSMIASQFWKQANTIQVIRANPEISRGFKMLPIIKQPGA